MSSEKMLDEMIMDEKKFVTYRMLGYKAQISSAVAQKTLEAFWKARRQNTIATFVITGKMNGGSGGNGIAIRIVSEDKVDQSKKQFGEVLSENIYGLRARSHEGGETKKGDKNNAVTGTQIWEADWDIRKRSIQGDKNAENVFFSDSFSSIKAPASICSKAAPRLSISAVSSGEKPKLQKSKPTSGAKKSMTTSVPLGESHSAPSTSTKKEKRVASKSSSFFSKKKGSGGGSSFSKKNSKKRKSTMGSWLASKSESTNTSTTTTITEATNVCLSGLEKTHSVSMDVASDDSEDEALGTSRLRRAGQRKRKNPKKRAIDSDEDEDPDMEVHQLRLAQEDDYDGGEGLDMRTEADMERERQEKSALREREERERSAAIEKQKQEMRKPRKRLVQKSYRDEDGFLVNEQVWEDIPEDELDAEEKSSTETAKESGGATGLQKKRPIESTRSKDGEESDAKKMKKKKKTKTKKGGSQRSTMFSFFNKK